MSARPLQAKDIPDAAILGLVSERRMQQPIQHPDYIGGPIRLPRWVSRWEVEEAMSDYPPKVVLAKVRSLIKRGLLYGCGCGCRGDLRFEP